MLNPSVSIKYVSISLNHEYMGLICNHIFLRLKFWHLIYIYQKPSSGAIESAWHLQWLFPSKVIWHSSPEIYSHLSTFRNPLRIEPTNKFECLMRDNDFLAALASSGLKGFPWTPLVPWSLLPNPIVVVSLMIDGLSLTALAASIAASVMITIFDMLSMPSSY